MSRRSPKGGGARSERLVLARGRDGVRRWRWLACASLLGLAVLAGCDETASDISTSLSDEAPATTASPPTEAPPAPEVPFSPERTFTGQVEIDDGGTWDLTIDVGELAPADGPELPAEFEEARNACTVSGQRDALLPIRLTAESTTSGFDTDIRTGLRIEGFDVLDDGDLYVEIASSFSDGPSCTEPRAWCSSKRGCPSATSLPRRPGPMRCSS